MGNPRGGLRPGSESLGKEERACERDRALPPHESRRTRPLTLIRQDVLNSPYGISFLVTDLEDFPGLHGERKTVPARPQRAVDPARVDAGHLHLLLSPLDRHGTDLPALEERVDLAQRLVDADLVHG